jgi:uncharacterized protein YwgA
MIHFYGPYSEALQADIGLLDAFGLVHETPDVSQDGNPYYILRAEPTAVLQETHAFDDRIRLLNQAPTVVLELAATYDAFREAGADHDEALQRLRRKKGSKCNDGNQEKALELLAALGLQAN